MVFSFAGSYRELLDNMDLALAIYRAVDNGNDFIFVDINSGVEEIEQVKKEDLIGKKVTTVFPGVADFGLLDVFKRVNETGTPERFPISFYEDDRISGWRDNYVYRLDSGEVVAIYRDETERKQLEEEIRKSRDEKNIIIEGAADPIIVGNEERILFLNQKAVEFLGYSNKEELIDELFLGLFGEDHKDIIRERARQRLQGIETSDQYDTIIERPNGTSVPVEFHLSLIEYEGSPAILNIIRDISERKRIEERLLKSEERFRLLYERAPLGYQSLDQDGCLIEVNNAWLNLLGYSHDEVIGRWFGDFLTPQYLGLFRENFPRFKEKGETEVEFEMLRKDGSIVVVSIYGTIGYDENRNFIQTHCNLQDITDRKHAEEALIESEAKYRGFLDGSRDGVTVNVSGKLVYVNPRFSEMIGYSVDELMGLSILDLHAPEYRELVMDRTVRRSKGEVVPSQYEVELVRKDGSLLPVSYSISRISYEGQPSSLTFIRDISERKRLEKEAQESEERFKTLFDTTREGILSYDTSGFIISGNQAAADILGYESPDEMIGINAEVLYYQSDDRDELLSKLYVEGALVDERISTKKKDGSVGFVSSTTTIYLDPVSGEEIRTSLFHDISERKRFEDEIKASEERYRGLFDGMIDGFVYCKAVYDDEGEPVDYTYLEINDRYTEIVGKGREILGRNVTEVWPGYENDPGDWISVYGELAKNGGELRLEQYEELTSKWYYVSAYSLEPGYFAIVFQDITEQKQIEQNDAESQRRLRSFLDSMDIGLAIWDKDFYYVDINRTIETRYNKPREEILGKHITEITPQITLERLKAYKKVRDTGKPFETDEAIIDTAEGDRRFSIRSYKVGEGVGNLTRDITEEYRLIEELQLSEERYRSLFNDSAAGILVRDDLGVITTINQAGAAIYGYEPHELVGKHVSTLWADQSQHLSASKVLVEEGKSTDLEIIIRKKDGAIGVIAANAFVRYDDEGNPFSFETFFREITKQKQAEEALQRSEDLFRGFMQSAIDAHILLDKDMRYIQVNDSWLQQSGLKLEDVIGKNVLEIFPEMKATGRYDAYLKVIETGEPVEFFEVESVSARGAIHDIHAFKTGSGLGVISRDVSERISYQRRLETLHGHAASLSRAESLEEVANITRDSLAEVIGFHQGGIGLVEDNYLIPRYIWGADTSESFPHSLDGPGITVLAVNSGKTQNIGEVRIDPNYVEGWGKQKTVSELAVPIIVSDMVVGVINLDSKVRDAFSENDQRLVETLSQHVGSAFSKIKYNERLNALHDLALELSYAESVSVVVETAFRIIKEVLGVQYASFQVLEDEGLVTIGTDGRPIHDIALPLKGKGVTTRAAREAHTVRLDDVRLDPDFIRGSTDSRSELAVPVVIEDRVLGVLNVESLQLNAYSEDDAKLMETLAQHVGATMVRLSAEEDKKELEREVFVRQVQVEQEQELSSMKTQFISTATHELRTPVTSILGYLELVLDYTDQDLSDEVRKDLNVVFRNANRLVSLTNDLLDVQRITSGRFEIQLEQVNVVNTLTDVLEELSPLFTEKKQKLIVNTPTELRVPVDGMRISQLLINLLRNANKFTPEEGKITITVESSETHVQISIKDTGIGLSEEDIGKLFKPFPGIQHGLGVTSTGLGLAICKGIVDLHEGEIWAESEGLGKGTTFTVTIPIGG